MTKQSSKLRHPTPPARPRSSATGAVKPTLAQPHTPTDLLALRAQLSRAEKAARRAPTPVPTRAAKPAPVKPQRDVELQGIATDDYSLHRAHSKLRDAVYDSRYRIGPHATAHARAEGFLEHDIMNVLLAGRVKAVYPEDHRWLVCGRFEACNVSLPLHVVVQHYRDGHIAIVTAFVPKHPHHIISRARLAVMLRYDDEQIKARTATPGNKVGNRSKGKWKRGA